MDSFLTALSTGAAGALTGKALAVKDNADQEEQQKAETNKLLMARMKQQADQEAEIRGRAFTHAQELQKALTPDNMAYMQQNGLLDQHQREIDNAMGVASGRVPTTHWNPQFAFEASPIGGTGSPANQPVAPGGTAATSPGAGGGMALPPGGAAPAPGGAAGGPSPAELLKAGGMIPRLVGPVPTATSTGAFGPTPPQPMVSAPTLPTAPAAPVQRRQFTPTVAQNITERQTAETEAAGKSTREVAQQKALLEKKEFNLKTAQAQFEDAMKTAQARMDAGKTAFEAGSVPWQKLLTGAIDVLKIGGGGTGRSSAVQALRSLLAVPNLFGRTPNKTAISLYMARSGMDQVDIDAVMADPSLAGGQTLDTVGGTPAGGADISRGAGGPPVLPPTGPAATPEQIDTALKARSSQFSNRAGGAPGTMGAARAAVAPPGAVTTPAAPKLAGNPRAIQEIAQMQPEAKTAAQAGFKALSDAGIPFTVNSTFRSHGEQAALVRQKQAGKNPNPVAKVGTSTHEAGMALDLSSGTGKQEDLARVLEPLGFKWAGAKDPVHFTYVGTPRQGQTQMGSRGGGRAPAAGTTQPPAGGAGGGTPKTDLAGAAKAVGVTLPSQAPALSNPYQPGTIGGEIFNKLSTGQITPEALINGYAHDPARQNLVQQIAEQIKKQQAGGEFGNAPTPSQENARLPTDTAIGSLGNLMYNEPGVGTPNMTTEPFETAPNTTRAEKTVQDKPAPVAGGKTEPPPKPKVRPRYPETGGGGMIGGPMPKSDSGGGGLVDQPRPQQGPIKIGRVFPKPDQAGPKAGINVPAAPVATSPQGMGKPEAMRLGGNLARKVGTGNALGRFLNQPIDPGSTFGRFLGSVNDTVNGQGPVYESAVKGLKTIAGPYGILYDAQRPPDAADRINKWMDALSKTKASTLYSDPVLNRDPAFKVLKPWMRSMGYQTADQVAAAYRWYATLDDRLRRPPYSLTEKQVMFHLPVILEQARSGRKPFRYEMGSTGRPTNPTLTPGGTGGLGGTEVRAR